jgi:hypothetical protein
MDRMRVSFFIGVALVPTLLSQLFTGWGSALPWWGWSLLLAAVIVALFGRAAVSDRRLQHRLAGISGQVHGVADLASVTDLVTTAHLGKPGPQNLHTLLPVLSGVRRVYLVVGEPPPGAPEAQDEVDALLSRAGRGDVQGRVLQRLPVADLDAGSIAALAAKLVAVRQLLGPGERALVDVTGGTVPMTLATYRAAVEAGLPVTYTSSRQGRAAGGDHAFRGLVAVHDPLGELSEGGA